MVRCGSSCSACWPGSPSLLLRCSGNAAPTPGCGTSSARYRATALFWEMHVGGAAIDAFLALTMPFVAWALWAARRPAPWLGAAALALLGTYACLTSFSRGVYLAVAVPLLALGLVLLVRRLGHRTRAVVVRVASVGGAVLLATALLFVALAAFGVPGLLLAAVVMVGGLALIRRRLRGGARRRRRHRRCCWCCRGGGGVRHRRLHVLAPRSERPRLRQSAGALACRRRSAARTG